MNKVYSLFCDGMMELRDNCIPTKISKLTQQPSWFTNRLRNVVKKQKRLYRLMKETPTSYNVNRYKNIRRQNKKLVKQSKKSYLSKTLYKPLLSGDSKAFYKYLKRSRENGSDIIPDLKLNNITAKSPQEKATLLNSFFQSVFVDDDGLLPNTTCSVESDNFSILVTREGVFKLLSDIKTSKSCGPDNLTGILLKTFSSCIANSLTEIFKYSLTTSSLPDVWKLAKVKPIFKKGDRCKPNNYIDLFH